MGHSEREQRCADLTAQGPYAIGLQEQPIAWIHRIRPAKHHLIVDITCPAQWREMRRLYVSVDEWEPTDDSPDCDPIYAAIFSLEEDLDDGQWRRWTSRPDGAWERPRIDPIIQRLLYEPLERNAPTFLGQFQAILEVMGRNIVLYVGREQWTQSPAPKTAWSPPEVLKHAGLVRMAPFAIQNAALDDGAGLWTLTLSAIHFPEGIRTVTVNLPPEKVSNGMNPPGFLWWHLRSAFEAWFDLHYSDTIPDSQRTRLYTYGGWFVQPDGAWVLDVLRG